MKLYNTLTRKIETVAPLLPPTVTVYTCGPTVYDYPHIGNWFTFIRYELLVRALRRDGMQPKWVMNITDVGHLVSDADEGEDKLEKGARREGKTAWDVASFYTDYFLAALDRLRITRPDYLPRATEHINEQIALVKQLEANGHTYIIDDGVYFDTSTFPRYSEFARLDIDEQEVGKRVEFNQQKRNPNDFALWKFSPKGQQRDMEWDSPWAPPGETARKGFPGWHLECSAMGMKYLGETIDIHSGGIDHVPVHHTNEIAQSEAATGKQFARYWMHTNHIMVENEKISKSLGNGITLEDIEGRGYDLDSFRLHVLESHYRSQSKFSWDSLTAAGNRLAAIRAMADLQFQTSDQAGMLPADIFDQAMAGIDAAVLNDLNTPEALRILSEVVDRVGSRQLLPADADNLRQFCSYLESLLGLQLTNRLPITANQQQLIDERQSARDTKDWQRSDELRNQLEQQGIAVNDTSLAAVWRRLQ